jgi:transcriptional regulator GlxA family with amidase domain
MTIAVILFDKFETLDVFGPVEVFGLIPDLFSIRYFALHGSIVRSAQGVPVFSEPLGDARDKFDILFIPGGIGTRELMNDVAFLGEMKRLSLLSRFLLTVCTGSLLAGKAGLLDGKKATTNKRVFSFVAESCGEVEWIKKARWVKDDMVYTSSGISAGIDMALAFVEEHAGHDAARQIADRMEYIRNSDSGNDPFAELYE